MGLSQSITVRVGADISAFRTKMGEVVGEMKSTATKISSSLHAIKNDFLVLGTAVSATLGIATKKSFEAFETYEKGLHEINTLLRIPPAQLKALGDAQRELAKEFGADVVLQLRGLYDSVSAQVVNATTATEHMRVVNRLAVAGLVDVETAGQAVLRLMRAYGPENLTAAKASDILFKTVEQGLGTMRDFAPLMGQIAGLAAAANIPIEELAAAFAAVTATSPPAEAATAVQALIRSIISVNPEVEKAAADIGIQWNAVALSTKGLKGLMDELATVINADVARSILELNKDTFDTTVIYNQLGARTGLATDKLSKMFPEVRALRGALALLAGGGKDFTVALDAMKAAAGAAEKAFKDMASTAAFQSAQLKASIKNLEISIGAALQPAIEKLVLAVKPWIDNVSKWIQANPKLAADIATVVVKIGLLAAGVAFAAVVLTGLAAAFGIVGNAVGIVTTSVRLLFLLITSHPIGLLITALGLLVLELTGTRAAITEAMGDIQKAFSEAFGKITGTVDTFGRDLKTKTASTLNATSSDFEDFQGNVTEDFDITWHAINASTDSGSTAMTGRIGEALESVQAAFRVAQRSIEDIWDHLFGFGPGSLLRQIAEFFERINIAVSNFINNLVGGLLRPLQSLGLISGPAPRPIIGIPGGQHGGLVQGPPGIDVVPAMLSAGEFVVNPRSTSDFLPLLEAINELGSRPGGGGGGGTTQNFNGPISLELPNVRSLNSEAAREFSNKLGRLSAKRLGRTDTRGLR